MSLAYGVCKSDYGGGARNTLHAVLTRLGLGDLVVQPNDLTVSNIALGAGAYGVVKRGKLRHEQVHLYYLYSLSLSELHTEQIRRSGTFGSASSLPDAVQPVERAKCKIAGCTVGHTYANTKATGCIVLVSGGLAAVM